MLLKSVSLFQKSIYEVLMDDAKLKKSVDAIYLSVQQDAKYPFILINMVKLDDFSKYKTFIYELEFEICLFDREKNQDKLLTISDHIIGLLRPSIIGVSHYQIVSLKFFKCEWLRGQDISTIKIIMRYKALITGENRDE